MAKKHVLQDYSHNPLPRTEHSNAYDTSLEVVKEQIDRVLINNHHVHAWLNEVQALINKAREQACQNRYDYDREQYTSEDFM